jgi:hypothetical protein
MIMSQTNQTALDIPKADLAEIKEYIQKLNAKLMPYLKTLSAAERMELPKMGDKTVSFVQKTMEYCRETPELVPSFLNVADFEADLRGFETLRSLYQPVLQISDALADTMLLTGSEAYTAALIFYNATKNAVKSKVPKAETIYDDLSARFSKGKRETTEVKA